MPPIVILDLAFGHRAFLVTGCHLRSHLRCIIYHIFLGCWTFLFYPLSSVNLASKFLKILHLTNIPCIHILSWLNECLIAHKISLPQFPFLFIFQLSTAPSWRVISPRVFMIRLSYFLLTPLNFLQHSTTVFLPLNGKVSKKPSVLGENHAWYRMVSKEKELICGYTYFQQQKPTVWQGLSGCIMTWQMTACWKQQDACVEDSNNEKGGKEQEGPGLLHYILTQTTEVWSNFTL